MLILPYSTALQLARFPYITALIIVLCIAIFSFQVMNQNDINRATSDYCHSVYNSEEKSEHQQMVRSFRYCSNILQMIHWSYDLDDWKQYYLENIHTEETISHRKKHIEADLEHYNEFLYQGAPSYLDGKLMYYPFTFNPFKMITSALSHADIFHILFNLIFYFAFTPALEVLIGSKFKFLLVNLGIVFIGGVAYSFTSMVSGSQVPTLGLSGVVMGMIGFSAYMMPRARIRTIFWFILIVRRLFIPVWVLAIWYIGWDIFELSFRTENGGTNFVAHVSGGISGYLIARFWFKDRREEIQEELDDEIEDARARRDSGRMNTSMAGQRRITSDYRNSEATKNWQTYKDKMHKFVQTGNSSEAVMLLIKDYDFNLKSPEIYEELFKDIGDWRKKRSYYCAGRLLINLYLEMGKTGLALQIINKCLKEDREFLLPDASKVLILAHESISHHKFALAYYLVKNFRRRYFAEHSCIEYVMLEANILFQHLDKKQDAISLLEKEISGLGIDQAQKLTALLEAFKV